MGDNFEASNRSLELVLVSFEDRNVELRSVVVTQSRSFL